MKLLILLIAMGVIAVIGTVEYSHAQTPLNIPKPDNFPDNTVPSEVTIDSDEDAIYRLSAYYDNIHSVPSLPKKIGAYFLGDYIGIEAHPLFPNTPENSDICRTKLIRYGEHKWNTNNVPIIAPKNIQENENTIIAIGMNVYKSCKINLISNLTTPIFTKQEIRITLYNQSEKKSYFFAPAENITKAQTIPLCSNENFNTESQTLKGETKMCYGKDGNDMIIITKRYLGFYGATEKILTAEETTKKIERQKALEKQEREYLALLKKLYLPAI